MLVYQRVPCDEKNITSHHLEFQEIVAGFSAWKDDVLRLRYPLVICYIAIENGPIEIVDVPIKNG